MRSALIATLLVVCTTHLVPVKAAGHGVALVLGGRFPPDTSPVGSQPEIVVNASYRPRSWPLGIDAFLGGSLAKELATVWPPGEDYISGHYEMFTLEAGLGARREWGIGAARPYLSAGGAFARIQTQETSDFWQGPVERLHAFGPWAGAGITWPVGMHTRVGLAGRFSALNAKREHYYDLPGGGAHVGLVLAWASRADQETH